MQPCHIGHIERKCFLIITIEIAQNAKYLQVVLDEHLVWDDQLQSLQTKLSHVDFLKCAKEVLLMQTPLCLILKE